MKKLVIGLLLILLIVSFVSAAKEKECLLHMDCEFEYGPGYACRGGNCVEDDKRGKGNIECLEDTDCSKGVCGEDGFCSDDETETKCELDEECEEGSFCSEGICEVESADELTTDETVTADEDTTSTSTVDETEAEGVFSFGTGVDEEELLLTQEIALSTSCLISADCPYEDDVCYMSLCFQGEIDDAGNVIVNTPVGEEKLNVISCLSDDDCGGREFCDSGAVIGNQQGFCSKTSKAAETDVTIATYVEPILGTYDSALMIISDDVEKAIIEGERTERLMDRSRSYEALALQGKMDIEKVENIQSKVQDQLSSLDQRTQVLKEKQLDQSLPLEQRMSLGTSLEQIENKQINLQLDGKRDLSRASTNFDSADLKLQEQKLQINDRVKESTLTPGDIALKQDQLKERQGLAENRLEQSQLVGERIVPEGLEQGKLKPTLPSMGGEKPTLSPDQQQDLKPTLSPDQQQDLKPAMPTQKSPTQQAPVQQPPQQKLPVQQQQPPQQKLPEGSSGVGGVTGSFIRYVFFGN